MPSYPFLHLDSGAGQQITNTSGNSSPWLYGSLPREAVCTENLTPWLKLLPCHGRQGLTQLLDRSTLYAASFHSMQVHLTVQTPPEHSSANDTAVSGSCSLEAGAKVGQVTPAFSPISLRQTLTIVIRPNQLHGGQPPGQLIGWGTPMQQNLTLQRLFNVHAVAACPKASHTHIYWQLPKALYSKLYSGSPALNASAIDNSLYTFSPAPDAVIASSDSLFALYDLTASSASSSNNKVAAEAPTSSNPTAVTLSNSSNKSRSEALNSNTQHDNASQICVQLSLTWRQQPAPWDPPGTPLQVQQLLAGRLGDRGSLVLHIGFRALAQQAESYDGSGSAEHLAQQADYEQQAQQEQQAQHDKKQGKQQTHHEEQQDGDTGHRNNSHEFCVFQMVPWHFQLLFHTLKLHVDGQVGSSWHAACPTMLHERGLSDAHAMLMLTCILQLLASQDAVYPSSLCAACTTCCAVDLDHLLGPVHALSVQTSGLLLVWDISSKQLRRGTCSYGLWSCL